MHPFGYQLKSLFGRSSSIETKTRRAKRLGIKRRLKGGKAQAVSMEAAAFRVVMDLYEAVIGQQEVVSQQEATVQLLHEANHILEVERIFTVDMQEETERLGNAQDILEDLDAQLSQAITTWNHLASKDASREQALRSLYPGPAVSQLSLNKPLPRPPPVSRSSGGSHFHSHQPTNRTGILAMTYPSPFPDQSPPTQWWMQEKDHYGLCQNYEQGQLESAARAAQFNRAQIPAPLHSTPTHQVSQPQHYSLTHQASQTQHYLFAQNATQAQHHSFTQQVSQAQHRQAPPPAMHLPASRVADMSHRGSDWSESEVMWLDSDFDPEFWQKHLRPGNLWADHPRRAIPEEDNLSPRALPRTLPAAPRI